MIAKVILLICCLLTWCSAECPSKCRCLGPWAKCHNGKLEDLTGDFPPEVNTMTLTQFDLQTLQPAAFAFLSFSSRMWKLELFQGNLESIKKNAFEGLGALESLYITQNKLETIEPGAFQGLSKLTVLDLSRNALRTLPQNVFQGLDKIFKIYLNHNKQLRTLDLSIFEELPSLPVLISAQNCGIQTLKPMISGRKNMTLDLRQNPLKCDCSLKKAVNGMKIIGKCDGQRITDVLGSMECY